MTAEDEAASDRALDALGDAVDWDDDLRWAARIGITDEATLQAALDAEEAAAADPLRPANRPTS